MMRNRILALWIVFMCGAVQAVELTSSTNPVTGLTTWKQADRGISLEIIQLSPEAAQATYSSRDLSPLIYESMRGYCVFGSVVRNETDAALAYRVADWRYVRAGGKPQRLRTKSQWVADWKQKGVNFGWSILPDDITLEVGDWALGYSPLKLAPGERFDLIYQWRQHGKSYTGTFQNLACPDVSGLR